MSMGWMGYGFLVMHCTIRFLHSIYRNEATSWIFYPLKSLRETYMPLWHKISYLQGTGLLLLAIFTYRRIPSNSTRRRLKACKEGAFYHHKGNEKGVCRVPFITLSWVSESE
ncbi:hypothetical protein K458DRAFT_175098 [Lentithecium fluviatile CBS 122367]|uniref:Uncharacterized protein n=1 Tax=Lentithecium fluviatile CBS 122367 TaxID=1168545 RepID=A0A6G1JD52_9PLEO|nr:hypothetical protein K458DRAFT_175098 [Lentithecium fluviatile CBS 122367]